MAKGMLFKNMEKEREKSEGEDKIKKEFQINPNQLASFHCQNTITKHCQIKGINSVSVIITFYVFIFLQFVLPIMDHSCGTV